jgi:hypothetical protein
MKKGTAIKNKRHKSNKNNLKKIKGGQQWVKKKIWGEGVF